MIDLAKLSLQGRAFSGSRPWTPEELDALLLIERERGIARPAAADYVRNGILTLEAFDKATKAEFKPKTLDEAKDAAEALLKDNDFADKDAEKAAKKAAKDAEKAPKGKK